MRQKRAFTLTELLTTVLILSILVAMTMASYADRKKRSEYDGARATINLVASAEKNYFLTAGSYVTTLNTADTDNRLNLRIIDGYFRNYRVNTGGGTFTALVDGGNCVYTFDSEGVRTSTNGGSDCLP